MSLLNPPGDLGIDCEDGQPEVMRWRRAVPCRKASRTRGISFQKMFFADPAVLDFMSLRPLLSPSLPHVQLPAPFSEVGVLADIHPPHKVSSVPTWPSSRSSLYRLEFWVQLCSLFLISFLQESSFWKSQPCSAARSGSGQDCCGAERAWRLHVVLASQVPGAPGEPSGGRRVEVQLLRSWHE